MTTAYGLGEAGLIRGRCLDWGCGNGVLGGARGRPGRRPRHRTVQRRRGAGQRGPGRAR